MAEIRLLRLSEAIEAMVALALVAQPVLAVAPVDAEAGEAQHQDLHAQVDVVADVVEGRVVAQVRPRGEDAAHGPERDDVAGGDGADVGARGVVDCPGEEAGAAGEGADLGEKGEC